MKGLHIFKAGCHTAAAGQNICFSGADISATAAAYSPDLSRAPLVLGHPESDDPAHGWAFALEARGNDLLAYVEHVSPQLKADVKAKRYRNISASFYPPRHPRNPKPGVFYLRHIGFLGANLPAVRHLQEPEQEALSYTELPLQCLHQFSGQPFTLLPGQSVETDRLKLHERVLEYMELNPGTDYLDAAIGIEQGQSLAMPAGRAAAVDRLKLHNRALEYMELNPGTDYLDAVTTMEQGQA